MNRLTIRAGAALFAGSLLALAGGAAVGASPVATPAQAAPAQVAATPTTTTLPLFGAPLTVDVTAAPGGAIATVTVDPADGLTASTVKPNKVKFVNEDGTARVEVGTRHGGERVEARAGTLADISGPGGWSGDLFGTGVVTTVGFDIAATAEGAPDITNVTTSDATAEIGAVEYSDDDGAQRARVGIVFTNGIEKRTLSIRVNAWSAEEASEGAASDSSHGSSAKVSISLSDVRGQRLPAGEVVGAHTWDGVLCDGSAASIAYTVNADGTLSDVAATPATGTVDTDGSKAWVSFSDREQVKIRVKSSDDGAELKVSTDERFWCERTDPTVNTPIDESIDDGHDGRDGHDGHGGWDGHDGDHRGGGHGDGDHRDGGRDGGGDHGDDNGNGGDGEGRD